MSFPELMNVEDAASVIGCTGSRVRQLLREGSMRGKKINARAWLIEPKEAERVKRIEHRLGRPRKNSS